MQALCERGPMAVKELYEWFVLNFEQFSRQKHSASWKNSIRHCLCAKVLSWHCVQLEKSVHCVQPEKGVHCVQPDKGCVQLEKGVHTRAIGKIGKTLSLSLSLKKKTCKQKAVSYLYELCCVYVSVSRHAIRLLAIARTPFRCKPFWSITG